MARIFGIALGFSALLLWGAIDFTVIGHSISSVPNIGSLRYNSALLMLAMFVAAGAFIAALVELHDWLSRPSGVKRRAPRFNPSFESRILSIFGRYMLGDFKAEGSNFSAACPKCGSAVQTRIAKRGRYRGRQFLGCVRYPACDGLISLKTSSLDTPQHP